MSRVLPAMSTRQGAWANNFMRKLYYTAGHIQKFAPSTDPTVVRWIVIAAMFCLRAGAQTSSGAKTAEAAMEASLQQQHASITKQVDSVIGRPAVPAASFFTVPWIDFPSFVLPPCDPVPAEQLDKLISDSSKQENVQADLIRAVIDQESGGRACAVSPKGAQGLMQIMPSVATQFGVQDPFDPKQNVDAGTKLLKQLLDKYKGDVKLTLAAYNAGSGRVDSEGGIPPINETINYVIDIVSKLPKK